MAIQVSGSKMLDDPAEGSKNGNSLYGQNGYTGASSVDPDDPKVRSKMTVNHDDSDPALAAVKATGAGTTSHAHNVQTRFEPDKAKAPAHGMTGPKPSGTVPASTFGEAVRPSSTRKI